MVKLIVRLTFSHDHVRRCITLEQCHSRAASYPFLSSKKQNVATNIYTVHPDQRTIYSRTKSIVAAVSFAGRSLQFILRLAKRTVSLELILNPSFVQTRSDRP